MLNSAQEAAIDDLMRVLRRGGLNAREINILRELAGHITVSCEAQLREDDLQREVRGPWR
jgi:tRNA C32,U32 (ribose-2'-O)-methylase TrmJ